MDDDVTDITFDEIVEELLDLSGLELEQKVGESEGERPRVLLSGADEELLLERDAALLEALQYLANRIMFNLAEEGTRVPGRIDAGGYRARRQEELEERARRLAARVRETGEPANLGQLSAYERRIVHTVVAEEEGVVSQSEGVGSERRLTISPGT